ncbi:hypothetical protein MMC06_001979 [Schaereria dolodes]|nr:hypothetical protein [Schaereria dolodes]
MDDTAPSDLPGIATVVSRPPCLEHGYHTYSFPSSDSDSPLSSLGSSPSPPTSLLTGSSTNEKSHHETIARPERQKNRPRSTARSRSRSVGSDILVTPTKSSRKAYSKVSPYFPKSPVEKISCIPFPPLKSTSFGLVQEKLCHEPFKLLVAVIFLNKTKGTAAMPVFYDLIARYPAPADLAAANMEDVVEMIQHLGLQNQRAATCIKLAQAWLENPPEKGKRYRKLHYPKKDDGKDIKADDNPISDEDARVAWEVGHLPGVGAYAIDSWRIFCRDELRGRPTGLPEAVTPETIVQELEKEWTRVLPQDKELRAYLRWRWLRLGWEWDSLTGTRKNVDDDLYAAAKSGGVVYEGDKHWSLEGQDSYKADNKVRVKRNNELVHGGDDLLALKSDESF